jgi:hypothetical protein
MRPWILKLGLVQTASEANHGLRQRGANQRAGSRNKKIARADLGLAQRRGDFNVNDHCVVKVDQIVSGVGEVGGALVSAGPTRGAISRRDELRNDRRRASENRVIQHRQILVDCAVRRCPDTPSAPGTAPPVGVSRDQAGIGGEALTANQALAHASLHDRLEQLAKQVAIAEAAVAVLREGQVVRDVAVEAEPSEPEIGEVQVNLLAQPPL